ncbi:hypothetical protein H4Q26_012422 [Puccinia striiformis f. sp. tritici PST-130]|nr:hypothetical protein H4Q26_012422 [Puccinia striiformis f. sp. tritici PST-130]
MAKLSLLELLSFRYKLDELPHSISLRMSKSQRRTNKPKASRHRPRSLGRHQSEEVEDATSPHFAVACAATQPTPGPKTQEQDLITLPVTESNTGPVYEDTWPPLEPKRSESPRGETSITDSKALTSLEATDLPPGTPTSDEMIHPAFRGTSNTGSGLTASQLQLLKDLEDLEEPQLQTATSGFVCPFCYEQLPDHHSDELKALYEYFKKESRGFTVKLPVSLAVPQSLKVENPRTQQGQQFLHNLDDFRVEIPGYHLPHLERMFLKKKSLAKITALALPMSPDYLIRKVLVPEAALGLIAQDLLKEIGDPLVLQTLQESRNYGAAVFSGDQDNSITPN